MAVRNLAARCARTDEAARAEAENDARRETRRRRGAYARASRDRCDVDDYACIGEILKSISSSSSLRANPFSSNAGISLPSGGGLDSSTRRVD